MASPAAVKKVLVPITAGSEPVEAFVPIAVLRRAGADVTVAAAGAGAGAGLRVHAMYGVTVVADASVADCADPSYDLVALPIFNREIRREKKRPIPFGLGRGGRSRHGVGVRHGGPAGSVAVALPAAGSAAL